MREKKVWSSTDVYCFSPIHTWYLHNKYNICHLLLTLIPVYIVGEPSDHVLPKVVVDADGRCLALHEAHTRVALELARALR